MSQRKARKIVLRNPQEYDIPMIIELCRKVYPRILPYSDGMLRGQQSQFPEGQFVIEQDCKIIGYCATFRIAGEIALKKHTWKEITGGGYASRHDPNGDYLYGMEVCVDPDYRGMRIGQRLYNERKKLCQHLRLKGIIFGGRIPGFSNISIW